MEYIVPQNEKNTRLDVFLSKAADLSRSRAAKLIEEGAVLLNGALADKKSLVCDGDTVSLDMPEPEPSEALPENIPLDIVYEDADVLVINKPKGLVVHPAASLIDCFAGKELVILNQRPTPYDSRATMLFRDSLTDILPLLAD